MNATKPQPAVATPPAPAPVVRRTCQWIVSNNKPRQFCAAPCASGRPYCTLHARQAYIRRGDHLRLPGVGDPR
jgi:hypothetical protein